MLIWTSPTSTYLDCVQTCGQLQALGFNRKAITESVIKCKYKEHLSFDPVSVVSTSIFIFVIPSANKRWTKSNPENTRKPACNLPPCRYYIVVAKHYGGLQTVFELRHPRLVTSPTSGHFGKDLYTNLLLISTVNQFRYLKVEWTGAALRIAWLHLAPKCRGNLLLSVIETSHCNSNFSLPFSRNYCRLLLKENKAHESSI